MAFSNGELIASFVLLGGITYFYRYSFLSARGRRVAEKIPIEFLRLLAPATFTAIVVNSLLAAKDDPVAFQWKVIVTLLALVVAALTRSIVVTLIFGLGLLYLLQNFFS